MKIRGRRPPGSGAGAPGAKVPNPCIGCGTLAFTRRCFRCECAYQAARNARPQRAAYRDPLYQTASKTGVCHICRLPGADTRDHVIPLIAGGTNHPSNIRPAHRSCNSSKGAHSNGTQ